MMYITKEQLIDVITAAMRGGDVIDPTILLEEIGALQYIIKDDAKAGYYDNIITGQREFWEGGNVAHTRHRQVLNSLSRSHKT